MFEVSMQMLFGTNYPLFQVWHPISLNFSTYNKIGEVKLPGGDFIGMELPSCQLIIKQQ